MSHTPILFKAPEPIDAGRNAIEAAAAEMADYMRVDRHDFFWLEKMIMEMGGAVETGGGEPLALETLASDRFRILDAGILLSVEQNRARTAIMVGHHALHAPGTMKSHPDHGMRVPADPDHPHAPPEAARREALHFATGLLMPANDFRAAWTAGGPEQCVHDFRVPARWVAGRAKALDLVQPESPGADGP